MTAAVAIPIAARFTSGVSALEQAGRFATGLVDGKIDSLDLVVWGSVLLGITCGLLGAFIVLRRQSLMGDAVGHAVLPGVCLGFMAAGTKSAPALLAGAMVAGLLAAALIQALQRTTKLKSPECIGAVFTGFYGLGIVLLKYIQNGGNFLATLGLAPRVNHGQAGLDKFLFGQIVGMSRADVTAMAIIAALSIVLVIASWRALAVSSFDEQFARTIGFPVRAIQFLLTTLLTAAIVISIQAVGVVLVSAMLITPAATAYLLTDRLRLMAVLSSLFGALAGIAGAFFSILGDDLPTGAFMVLAATALFAAAFLLSPGHGLLPRAIRLWRRRRDTQAQNLLRTLYILSERRGATAGRLTGDDRRFGVHDVAAARQESPGYVRDLVRLAAARGWVEPRTRDPIVLTDAGLAEARRVVRNHRLWELFLTQEAKLGADQVHADAEYIEHVLPKDVLSRLEKMLDNPAADPHGRAIPAPNGGGAA